MTQIITFSSTTAGDNITAADNEFIHINEGVTRASTGADALVAAAAADNVFVSVAGNLVGRFTGIFLQDSVDETGNFNVIIAETGSVIGGNNAVQMSDDGNRFTNHGTVYSESIAFRNTGADFVFNNTGTISSVSSDGLRITGDNAAITNHGTISGAEDGVEVSSTGAVVTNYGLIQSTDFGEGVELYDNDATEAVTLFNYGTVSTVTGLGAFRGDFNDTDIVHNYGTFNGSSDHLGGDDEMYNDGLIVGDVNLGDGSDIYDGMSSGEVTGRVNGGNDSDSLFGSSADDDLRGDNQSDLIEGNGGDDDLLGGQGQDVIRGGDGNDRLFGQSNGDSLNGGAGLDRLSGGLANDTFVFEIGNDVDIIDDFANNGIEKIDLRDFASADAMAAIANAYQVSFQVRIDFGDGDMLAINGITVADLDNSDFIFA